MNNQNTKTDLITDRDISDSILMSWENPKFPQEIACTSLEEFKGLLRLACEAVDLDPAPIHIKLTKGRYGGKEEQGAIVRIIPSPSHEAYCCYAAACSTLALKLGQEAVLLRYNGKSGLSYVQPPYSGQVRSQGTAILRPGPNDDYTEIDGYRFTLDVSEPYTPSAQAIAKAKELARQRGGAKSASAAEGGV